MTEHTLSAAIFVFHKPRDTHYTCTQCTGCSEHIVCCLMIPCFIRETITALWKSYIFFVLLVFACCCYCAAFSVSRLLPFLFVGSRCISLVLLVVEWFCLWDTFTSHVCVIVCIVCIYGCTLYTHTCLRKWSALHWYSRIYCLHGN